MAKLKKIVASLILLTLCGSAIWKNMQTLAIFSVVLFLCVLYMEQVKRALSIGYTILQKTKSAKFKDFEFNIEDPLKQIFVDSIPSDKNWAKAVIYGLSSIQISLLLAVNKVGEFQAHEPFKNNLRVLRDAGLVKTNKKSMYESDIVCLTPLGHDLVDVIAKQATNQNSLLH